jgi:deoxyxylulose-5-phosphate synthase
MNSQTLYCYLKQIKENKKKVITMALTKKGMRRTASQTANEGYQFRKYKQLQEPINKKPEKEYFKQKRNSQVTYNY